MKQYAIAMMTILVISVQSLLAQRFSAVNAQGQTIYYYIMIDSEGECAVTNGDDEKYSGDLVIPDSVDYDGKRYAVTHIGSGAFSLCPSLTSLTFPETIRSFGLGVFPNSNQLTKLYFPSLDFVLRLNSFEEPPRFDRRLRINGEEINDLAIPEGVTTIDGALIYRFTHFKSIKFPSTLKSIKTISLGGLELERVEYNSLEQVASIEYKYAQSNPLYFTHHLFIDGKEVTEIELPDTLTSIHNFAFIGCSELRKVTMPQQISRIGKSAFQGCSKLDITQFPNELSIIDFYAFKECTSLSNGDLPKSVELINSFAFQGCSNLTKIEAMGVNRIESEAFQGCSLLEEAYFGNLLTYVNRDAFKGTSLRFFSIKAGVPPECWYQNDILDVDRYIGRYNATLEVPKGCRDNYLAQFPWNRFKEIIESDEEPEGDIYCAIPNISYQNGTLIFTSDTPNAVYHYSIEDADIVSNKDTSEGIIRLQGTYQISVYASVQGKLDSDIATATLCWLDADLQLSNPIVTQAKPVLIKNIGDEILIEGVDAGVRVDFYSMVGAMLGSVTASDNPISFATTEDMVIIKIGRQSFKVTKNKHLR